MLEAAIEYFLLLGFKSFKELLNLSAVRACEIMADGIFFILRMLLELFSWIIFLGIDWMFIIRDFLLAIK